MIFYHRHEISMTPQQAKGYNDLMKVINVLDLPLKINKKYVQEVINFIE